MSDAANNTWVRGTGAERIAKAEESVELLRGVVAGLNDALFLANYYRARHDLLVESMGYVITQKVK